MSMAFCFYLARKVLKEVNLSAEVNLHWAPLRGLPGNDVLCADNASHSADV